MKKILTNALKSILSTMAGAVAGGAIVLEGVSEHNVIKIISGVAVVILGAITNEQGNSAPRSNMFD